MARKLADDLENSTAPKKGRGKRDRSSISMPKVAAYSFTAFLLLASGLYGFYTAERYLVEDARFALNESGDSARLTLSGTAYSSVSALQAVFHQDLGKSVYLLPLEERRESLRNIAWVKDAAIARIWPNRLTVRIWERSPVAFVPGNGSSGYSLIDAEGVLLPPVAARFRLPVINGLNPKADLAERQERVTRMLLLTGELGEDVTRDLSEIDVSDKDNMRVTQPQGTRVLTLLLGDRNFAARYKNFQLHFDEIRKRLPDAVTLDLRLEDRITVVE